MSGDLLAALFAALVGDEPDDGGEDPGKLPPGSPPTRACFHFTTGPRALTKDTMSVKFEGPWFTTQLSISLTVGFLSFMIFSYCRMRWPLLFAPRTKLKGACSVGVNAHKFIMLLSKVFHLTRRTRTRHFLAGLCLQYARRNLQCCRLSGWTLLWCVFIFLNVKTLP